MMILVRQKEHSVADGWNHSSLTTHTTSAISVLRGPTVTFSVVDERPTEN